MQPANAAILSIALFIVSGCAIEDTKQASSPEEASFWCRLISCGVVVPIDK